MRQHRKIFRWIVIVGLILLAAWQRFSASHAPLPSQIAAGQNEVPALLAAAPIPPARESSETSGEKTAQAAAPEDDPVFEKFSAWASDWSHWWPHGSQIGRCTVSAKRIEHGRSNSLTTTRFAYSAAGLPLKFQKNTIWMMILLTLDSPPWPFGTC